MVGVILLAAQVSVLARVLWLKGRPPLRADSAIFEYAGWYMANGASLYTDIWEIKLPLAYQTTQVTAYLVGSNVLLHHLVNVALTIAVGTATAVLVASLAHDVTGDDYAGLLAGVSVLLLPGYFYLPAFGFKAKFYAVLAGLAAIWLATRDSSYSSGIAAAASVGYYQLALIFPLVVLGLGYQRRGIRGTAETAIGGALATTAMLAPVVVSGNVGAMLTETVIVPLVAGESGTSLVMTILLGGYHFGFAIPAVLVGGLGILFAVTRYELRETWWVGVSGLWFALVVLFVDYDSYPDLIPGLVFVAIGIGIVTDQLTEPTHRRLLRSLVLATVLVNVVAVLSFGGLFGVYSITPAKPLDDLQNVEYRIDDITVERPDVRYLYWKTIESETCHVRLSGTELRWLAMSDARVTDSDCGDLDTALQLLRRKMG